MTAVLALVFAFGLMAGPAVANGHGNNRAADRDAPRGNSLVSVSEPLELQPGDVEVRTSDPGAANFDAEFDYYVVRGIPEYTRALYREPARLGGDNFMLGGGAVGSFWLGVSAPDNDGIQHEIVHDGTLYLYFEVDDGWQHLKLQFEDGVLLNANGVAPE